MIASLLLLLFVILFVVVVYLVIKNFVKLAINSIVGVLILFGLNFFHVMSYFGKPDIAITWLSVVVCAIGGIVGVVLVIILHLAGIPV